MKHGAFISSFLGKTFWGIMAVLCVLFSSASKRLIQLKLAPYLTVNETAGKKLKDGCRDRKEKYKLVIRNYQKKPGKDVAQAHSGCFATVSNLGLAPRLIPSTIIFTPSTSFCAAGLPLYLSQRRLLL